MEKCYTFKGQSLENGLSCIFQATGNILILAKAMEYKGESKRNRSNMESDLFFHITQLVSSSLKLSPGHWLQSVHCLP